MRAKITMDTIEQAHNLEAIARTLDGNIYIKDINGLCVNAKSLIGLLHAMEFSELWLESDKDYYNEFRPFINGMGLIDNDSVVLKRETKEDLIDIE